MSERVRVHGVAVKSGVSKNMHKFLPEELQDAVKRSEGKTFPLLKDHVATTDSTVGRVKFSDAIFNSKGETLVKFEGFVMEDGSHVVQKIRNEILTEVSIGAYADKIVKESEDSDEVILIGIHFAELSLTPTPAVDGTGIARANASDEGKEVATVAENNVKAEAELEKVPEEGTKAEGDVDAEKQKLVDEEEVEVKDESKTEASNKNAQLQEEIEALKVKLLEQEKAALEAKLEASKPAKVEEKVDGIVKVEEDAKPAFKEGFNILQENNRVIVEADWNVVREKQLARAQAARVLVR